MPKSKAGKAAQSLAVEALMADHRKVDALFKQYEKGKRPVWAIFSERG